LGIKNPSVLRQAPAGCIGAGIRFHPAVRAPSLPDRWNPTPPACRAKLSR